VVPALLLNGFYTYAITASIWPMKLIATEADRLTGGHSSFRKPAKKRLPTVSTKAILCVAAVTCAIVLALFTQQAAQGPNTSPLTNSASPSGRRAANANYPLSWDRLLQMTGNEGPQTEFFRDGAGNLVRVEARHRLSVIVTVETFQNGFAVAVGHDLAVADFTTRRWFTSAESSALQDVYAEYVADRDHNDRHARQLSRFIVIMGNDRKYTNMPCFVLVPIEE
jgi:hypothetical protein